MPSAIERDHELSGRGLVTIMMERQGADQATLEAFLAERYPGYGAMACVSGPHRLPQSRGLPNAALVGIDGTLLWTGNPISGEKQIDELIAEQLQRRAMGFGDSEEAVEVRRQIYGKRSYEDALEALEDVGDQTERARLRAELEGVVEREFGQITKLQQRGRWIEAKDAAQALARAVKGVDAWEERADAVEDLFKTRQGKDEISAQKTYERTIARIVEVRSGGDVGRSELAPVLEQLLEKVQGTAQEARVRRQAAIWKVTL